MTDTTPLNITDTQRANLRKLADGLEAKAGEINLDMARFNAKLIHRAECGTVGCIIGNAPFLGVPGFERQPIDLDWEDYSHRLFAPVGNLWAWLFDGPWVDTDNTVEGAVGRIRWTLEHGLPANWYDQMRGCAPLCYEETDA